MRSLCFLLSLFWLTIMSELAAQVAGWEPHTWAVVNHTQATAVGYCTCSAGLFLLSLVGIIIFKEDKS